MSANIPLDIQVEIIKRVLPVKSLIRFRSVSKQWKSLIDSSRFINDHSVKARPHHLLIRYEVDSEYKYVSIADDDSFPLDKFSHIVPPTIKPLRMIGCSHGLVCLYGLDQYEKNLIVLWNPLVRKSVAVVLPNGSDYNVGFGVCPKTSDPKIVKITSDDLRVEVFTLSSRTWKSVSWNSPPYESLEYIYLNRQVVIDGVIYWLAHDLLTDGFRVISFDLTCEEFGEVDLPDSLIVGEIDSLHIYELNESLAMLNYLNDDAGKRVCDVWMLKDGVKKSLSIKLFTITIEPTYYHIIKGFRKNGQPIVEHLYKLNGSWVAELQVYERSSEIFSSLRIFGRKFMMTSYTESLLLLNNHDSIIQ